MITNSESHFHLKFLFQDKSPKGLLFLEAGQSFDLQQLLSR